VKNNGEPIGRRENHLIPPTKRIYFEEEKVVKFVFFEGFRLSCSVDYQLLQKEQEQEIELSFGSLCIPDNILRCGPSDKQTNYYPEGNFDDYYLEPFTNYKVRSNNAIFEGRTIRNYKKLSHVTNPILIVGHPEAASNNTE